MIQRLQISTDGYLFRILILLLIASGWGILLNDLIHTKQEFLHQRGVAKNHHLVPRVAETSSANTDLKKDFRKNEVSQNKNLEMNQVLSVDEQIAKANAGFAAELFTFVSSDDSQKLIAQAKGFLIKGGRTRVSEKVTQIFGQILSQLRAQKKKLSYTLEYGSEIASADVALVRNYFSTFYGINLQENAGAQSNEFSLIVEVGP